MNRRGSPKCHKCQQHGHTHSNKIAIINPIVLNVMRLTYLNTATNIKIAQFNAPSAQSIIRPASKGAAPIKEYTNTFSSIKNVTPKTFYIILLTL